MATRVMLAQNKSPSDDVIHKLLVEAGFLYQQPKIDGLRASINDSLLPITRSGKEHKHKYLRQWSQDWPQLKFLDGEVSVGHEYSEDSFRESMSGMRAAEGNPEFTFYAFDYAFVNSMHYRARMDKIAEIIEQVGEVQKKSGGYFAKLVMTPTVKVYTVEDVRRMEAQHLADKWEGSMLRHPYKPYKFGRSTNLQGHLIKLKRFEDTEAVVIGYEAYQENQNESIRDDLGYLKKTAHKENKVDKEMIGAWHVRLLNDASVEFKVGVMRGVTHEMRRSMWPNREQYIGKIMKLKHQGYGGGYDKPRTPVFLNWRDKSEF